MQQVILKEGLCLGAFFFANETKTRLSDIYYTMAKSQHQNTHLLTSKT